MIYLLLKNSGCTDGDGCREPTRGKNELHGSSKGNEERKESKK